MTSFMAPRVGIVLHGWSVKVLELVFARSFMMEGIQEWAWSPTPN